MWKSGCWCANAVLTSNLPQHQRNKWTGRKQVEHIPTSGKCPPSSPVTASQLQSPPSLPPRKQLQAYTMVRQHLESGSTPPLRMIVAGTAGTANPLPETATQGQSACGSTHRCSSIQHRWPHPPLPPGPACQGRLQGFGGSVSTDCRTHWPQSATSS